VLSLAAAALILSALAVPLPSGACFSAATPLWLWLPHPGASLLGLGFQTLIYAIRGCRGRQLGLDALAGLGALGLSWLGCSLWEQNYGAPPGLLYGKIFGLLVYLLLVMELRWRWAPRGPQRVAYLRMQRWLRRLHLVSALAVTTWQEPFSLALLPLLLSTHWAASNERFRVEAQLDEELRQMQSELSQVIQQKDQLQASQHQRLWLDRLSQQLESARDLQDWCRLMKVGLQEGLMLVDHLQLVEQSETSTSGPMLERNRLLVPLQANKTSDGAWAHKGLAVLVTRQHPDFSPDDIRCLGYCLGRGRPVLSKLLERRKVDQLHLLLESNQKLTAQLGVQALLEVLPEICQGVVMHAWGLLSSAQGSLLARWGALSDDEVVKAQRLVQQAYREGIPVSIAGGLALPLADAQGWVGCLALGAHADFSPEQKQTLQLLAQQLLSAWLRAQALEQLAQAQRQLVLSSKMVAVGGLAAGVAHELNSPLGAITLMLEGAMRQLHQPDSARSKLERAQQACRRAKEIVERLLTQARNPGSQAAPFRLDDCLREALPFVEPQLAQAGVNLSLKWTNNPSFTGQASTVQQVLINLLHNAAQASGPDKQVEIATYPWGFSVTDWGVGISPELAARIFEPFFTTRQGGHGLGLWICQDLLRQQGGEIRLASGHPTRFEVHLRSLDSGNP